ncbi:hypothetical protein BOTBODRAFT_34063 [Botryobasidium botryosum FD-172 SS1]|uniref:G domain-containing protein n=1 Tax=Botryobasidium botryosum (strain FD-172 SS1) TaxID=930990 RepID=A0A067MBJ1_BOTB1|nr:hypothetical protein BOTBODRAFT_34063 [Botryobasidium botryosum FD-172 SS1]
MDSYDHDYSCTIGVAGGPGVGKTNLVSQFVKHTFSSDYAQTNSLDCNIHTVEAGGNSVRLFIRDTSEPGRTRSMKYAFYKYLDAALAVYDISDRMSYCNILEKVQELRKESSVSILLTLVGNKNDLVKNRVVSTEEARSFAAENGMSFMETSALDGSGVEAAFKDITTRFVEQEQKEEALSSSEVFTGKPLSLAVSPAIPLATITAPRVDDAELDFPRISEWLQSLDKSKRGRDGQNFARYGKALEDAGYTRIDSLDNPAHVTSQKLIDLAGMLPGHADNILKWVVVDIAKLRGEA